MKKLKVPTSGTAPANTPLHNMLHHRENTSVPQKEGENKRTTIYINSTLYRKFKAYAAESGQTITALFNNLIEEALKQAGKE